MSLAALRSNIAAMAHLAAQGRLAVRIGLVSSFDGRAGGYLVKVRLQPEDVETGWLPIKVLLSGQGWGVYAGPSQNDQAVVIFADGDVNAGICAGFLPSDSDPAPAVAPGEIHLRAGGDTASIIARPDGSIASKGTWTHTGTLRVTGAVTLDAALTVAGNVSFTGSSVTHGGVNIGKTHIHSGVQTGAGVSGGPQ